MFEIIRTIVLIVGIICFIISLWKNDIGPIKVGIVFAGIGAILIFAVGIFELLSSAIHG